MKAVSDTAVMYSTGRKVQALRELLCRAERPLASDEARLLIHPLVVVIVGKYVLDIL
jgi:hypothetical protein